MCGQSIFGGLQVKMSIMKPIKVKEKMYESQ